MEKTREIATSIIDLFEELFDEYDITIPNKEREESDDDSNARIYGTDYFTLEDEITCVIENCMRDDDSVEEKYKSIAIFSIDNLEDLMEEHGLEIPNDEREDEGLGTAPIYGIHYGDLSESIISLLYENATTKEENAMEKFRIWWIPQIGIGKMFHVPVESPEEGRKVMDLLAAYDIFQFENNVKPDFSNAGGLEVLNEETGEWEDWMMETDTNFYDDLDEYCESDDCKDKYKLEWFKEKVFENCN